MVLRSLVGALVAVAIIGAVAAALPDRAAPVGQSPAPAVQQFGQLAKPQFEPKADEAARSVEPPSDQQALLKLAAFPAFHDAPSATVSAAGGPAKPEDRAMFALAGAPQSALPESKPNPVPTPTKPLLPAQVEPPSRQDQPSRVAALPQQTQDAAPSKGGQVNINRASVSELDHLPGGGRIGLAIARRRPYRSVDDLVRKRVLREAAFRRIRSAITVD